MTAAKIGSLSYLLLVATLCLGLAGGCSDDSQPADASVDNGDAGVDEDALAADASTAESLTIQVLTMTGTPPAETPLEGATVAFDMPGSERVEQVTDADGKTTFEGIDWSAGKGMATAHLEGYTMATLCDIDQARIDDIAVEGTLRLGIYPLQPEEPETVTLSGTFTGLVDTSHIIQVSVEHANPVGSVWQGKGTQTFQVNVPKGKPFVIQGLEYDYEYLPSGQGFDQPFFRMMYKSFDAITQNSSSEVLDFEANEVSFQTVDATYSLPERIDSPLCAGFPYCLVFSPETKGAIGWPSHGDIDPATGMIDISITWTTPSWAEDVYTFCRVQNYVTGDYSIMREEGYPKAGEMDPPLLDVPKWVNPAQTLSGGKAPALHSPLEWELFDEGVYTQLHVIKENRSLWVVHPGIDATTVSLPDLPSSVNRSSFFGSDPLQVSLVSLVFNEERTMARRYAMSQTRMLKP